MINDAELAFSFFQWFPFHSLSLCSLIDMIMCRVSIVPMSLVRLSQRSIALSRRLAMTDHTVYQFTAKDVDGHEVSLDKYKGRAVLIVNVASQCGLTSSNYTQLKELLDKYKQSGLDIAAFPCNQFGGQEPACELDIKNFVHDKYHFEPDLYSKIDVNGNNAHPLYKFLKKEQGGMITDGIKWNFTKFLVNREGKVVKRFSPTDEPKNIEKDIQAVLDQPSHI